MEKVFYLEEKELAILLAAVGQKELYGYPLQVDPQMEKRTLSEALFAMAQKEIITLAEQGIKIEKIYAQAIDQLRKAERLWILSDAEQKKPELFLYIADKVVSLEMQGQRSSLVRIGILEKKDLPEKILSERIRVESFLQREAGAVAEKPIENQKLQTLAQEWFLLPEKELVKQKKIISIIRMHGIMSTGKPECQKKQILVVSYELEDYLLVSDSAGTEIYYYSEIELKRLLGENMGG